MKFKILNEAQVGDINPETGFQSSPSDVDKSNASDEQKQFEKEQKKLQNQQKKQKSNENRLSKIGEKIQNDSSYAKSEQAIQDIKQFLNKMGIA